MASFKTIVYLLGHISMLLAYQKVAEKEGVATGSKELNPELIQNTYEFLPTSIQVEVGHTFSQDLGLERYGIIQATAEAVNWNKTSKGVSSPCWIEPQSTQIGLIKNFYTTFEENTILDSRSLAGNIYILLSNCSIFQVKIDSGAQSLPVYAKDVPNCSSNSHLFLNENGTIHSDNAIKLFSSPLLVESREVLDTTLFPKISMEPKMVSIEVELIEGKIRWRSTRQSINDREWEIMNISSSVKHASLFNDTLYLLIQSSNTELPPRLLVMKANIQEGNKPELTWTEFRAEPVMVDSFQVTSTVSSLVLSTNTGLYWTARPTIQAYQGLLTWTRLPLDIDMFKLILLTETTLIFGSDKAIYATDINSLGKSFLSCRELSEPISVKLNATLSWCPQIGTSCRFSTLVKIDQKFSKWIQPKNTVGWAFVLIVMIVVSAGWFLWRAKRKLDLLSLQLSVAELQKIELESRIPLQKTNIKSPFEGSEERFYFTGNSRGWGEADEQDFEPYQDHF